MQPVVTKGFAAVAGRQRLFLIVVFLVAVVVGVVAERSSRGLWLVMFAVTGALFLLMLALSLLAAVHHRPAVLEVRPERRAFGTAADLAPVFSAAAFIVLAGALVTEDVGDIVDGEELWGLNVVTAALWAFAVLFHLYVALGPFGVRLHPEGVADRQPFGSLFVPWEAFATVHPAVSGRNGRLDLYYERPELVRRRGLLPSGRSLRSGTDPAYLAAAIHQYVTNAECRSAIGSETELRRLTARLAG
jgi:hypothetical protein